MMEGILHIGITVNNMDNSIKFYRDILGLEFSGKLIIEGEEADLLFGEKNIKVRIVYFNCNKRYSGPSIELIEFLDRGKKKDKISLLKNSISEICFKVENIEKIYEDLIDKDVNFISKTTIF